LFKIQKPVLVFIGPVYAADKDEAVPFHVLPQGKFVLPAEMPGKFKNSQGKAVHILKDRQIIIQGHKNLKNFPPPYGGEEKQLKS
jgi:hypothetical protein